jgi:selenocysteine lyase/cysteine desulfurase
MSPWLHTEEDEAPKVRELYSRLINAEGSHCIALAPSTAFAMSVAAKNLVASGRLRMGGFIIALQNEMASNVYPWQEACRVTGANFLVVPRPTPPFTWAEAIIDALHRHVDSTAALALSPVHWCDGSSIDIKKVSEYLLHIEESKRPWLILDGTQCIGAQTFDVGELQPDFVACSVHKWLMCPHGVSLMYLHPRHHSTWSPLDFHERSRLGSDESSWDSVGTFEMTLSANASYFTGGYPELFLPGARRIDAGGRPNPIVLPMLAVSLEILGRVGQVEAIQRYLTHLTDMLADAIERHPASIIEVLPKGMRSGHIIGLRLKETANSYITVHDLAKDLQENARVSLAVRHGCIRLAPHVYVTPEEVSQVVSFLTNKYVSA